MQVLYIGRSSIDRKKNERTNEAVPVRLFFTIFVFLRLKREKVHVEATL